MSPQDPLVEVANLRVAFSSTGRTAVDGISFQVAPGECLALVGESGSGKSVTSRALVGLAGQGARVEVDRLRFEGRDLARLSGRQWRRLRGGRIGFVMQDALSSLDALRPVGREVAEPLALHTPLTRRQRWARVLELLRAVGVPEPELRASQRPHELSGGLRQRALIASAIACDPTLVVADEPTTALDATIGAQVIQLLATLKTAARALIVISHDLAVVASLADRVAVMREGRIVEQGSTAEVLRHPRHPYTRALLAAVPSAATRGAHLSFTQAALGLPDAGRASRTAVGRQVPTALGDRGGPVVSVRDLTKGFPGPDGRRRVAVEGVSFDLFPGEVLGLVGESGSGKTTTARLVLGLEMPDAGMVSVHGRRWEALTGRERRALRRRIQVVYQDPLSSFDPRYTVERVIGEAIEVAGLRGAAHQRRLSELLELVSLDDGFRRRRPIELSGGQRQRVAVARALAPDPDVIVCDEPVSALDVSVQARILDLLADLRERLGVAYLFISHDLGVVRHMSDRVLVMKDGLVVESGDVEAVFDHPRQEYTRALLAAIPRLVPAAEGDESRCLSTSSST